MRSKYHRITSIILSVLILAVPAISWANREAIYDAYRLHNYQAPSTIAALATDDTMTDAGRHLFYVYHPSLEDKLTFNTHCQDSEKTIVLGCYILHKGIYIYSVTDSRLNGVEQVTGAHEMLHAAYDRLNTTERNHINDLILQAYANVNDPRIRSTIDSYRQTGADTTNELHSILGTEVRQLPPELEHYYSRYFNNRAAIVSYSEKYEGTFRQIQSLAAQYNQQLDSLKKQIDSLSTELRQEKNRLDTAYSSLQRNRNSISDINLYNQQVNSFNSDVGNYNAKVSQDASLIDEYNSLLIKYNSLVGEEKQLYQAIDSRPSTVKSQ